MSPFAFWKMQASGNDFVVVRSPGAGEEWVERARNVCDRRFGVGADGILIVSPSRQADCKVRVINSDGSEAEICGNGLTCIGNFVLQTGIIEQGRDKLTVETLAGIKTLELSAAGANATRVRVDMGRPRLKAEEIPVLLSGPETGPDQGAILDYPLFAGNRRLSLSFVSMGNPHAVQFVAKPVADYPLRKLGPVVEHHPAFPQRVNFEIARVLDRSHIEARVWERGAEETLACGSGACAIAVAARLHDFVDDEVEVALPGGRLLIQWDGKGEVALNGTSRMVFSGTLNDDGG